MKAIVLTRGRIATVDDEDFDRVNQFKWCAMKRRCGGYYAARSHRHPDGKKRLQYLHQFLLGVRGGDHKNGDGLDNRRENLRVATRQQNLYGFRREKKPTSSQYRGVSWVPKLQKWSAQIQNTGKKICLGWFMQESDAARAYDAAAVKFAGEFASLNFPK